MTTIIFKNEKKAKVYEVRAAKSFHIYSEGELINRVKTDKIEKLNENFLTDQIIVTKIK
jgi:Holliday junction resolvase-like predicted endonuclease